MGKTTLLKHLFLNTIENTKKIPIFLELLDFNNSQNKVNIADCLKSKLDNLGCRLEPEYLDWAFDAGAFVFLFDGYDELIESKRDDFFMNWWHLVISTIRILIS